MTTDKCQYCGSLHEFACPIVKAIEYYSTGKVKRVEFKTAQDYPQFPSALQPVIITTPAAPSPYYPPLTCIGVSFSADGQIWN